jgi:hypothetical protein
VRVANRAETLGGEEASRFRTISLSLETRRVSLRLLARVCGTERKSALFVFCVGNEGVNHEVAVQGVREVDV